MSNNKQKGLQPRDSQGRFLSWPNKTVKNTVSNSSGTGSKSNSTPVSSVPKKATQPKVKSKIKAVKEAYDAKSKSASKTTTSKNTKTTKEKQIVHNVHLVDASTSMKGEKYEAAFIGINSEIKQLKKGLKGIQYTQSIYEFSSGTHNGSCLITHYVKIPMSSAAECKGGGVIGYTALYQAVGELIEKMQSLKAKEDKVLLTIFTDGGENDSHGKYRDPNVLKQLIKAVEKEGFTVTFMGTKFDTDAIIKNVGINASNTISHDNTAESIGATYAVRGKMSQEYSKKVISGQSVTLGFFTDENK